MFNNKQVKDLEIRLETLIKELQDNKVLGESWFDGYLYASNNNEKLAGDTKRNSENLDSVAQALAALMKYLEVEYTKETEKKIRKISTQNDPE